MSNNKKCIVGYTTQVYGSGRVHGHRFCKLKTCCETFAARFNETLFKKASQGFSSDVVSGINFESRGGEMEVLLSFSGLIPSENEMKFCPFCGATIEVKQAKVVELKDSFKKVRNGYKEKVLREAPL